MWWFVSFSRYPYTRKNFGETHFVICRLDCAYKTEMKLNIAYPATGPPKLLKIEEERIYRIFFEKRMAQEMEVDALSDEWKVGRFI